jgi:hypothetical protein
MSKFNSSGSCTRAGCGSKWASSQIRMGCCVLLRFRRTRSPRKCAGSRSSSKAIWRSRSSAEPEEKCTENLVGYGKRKRVGAEHRRGGAGGR